MNQWKTSAEQILTAGPVVPVIVINKLEHAVPLAKALVAGGVRVLEVTLRTACAMDAIRAIAQEVPEAIIGAGTVINPQQLREVTEAGAQFAISPGLTDELLNAATAGSIPLIPGISTVSELMLGMDYGLREFKFFPAEANGGVKRCRRSAARSRRCASADRRYLAGQLPQLPGAEKRTVHRRLLAGAGGRAGKRRLRPHHRTGARRIAGAQA